MPEFNTVELNLKGVDLQDGNNVKSDSHKNKFRTGIKIQMRNFI